MRVFQYKLSRRTMLIGVVGVAGAAALIGGATGVIPLNAQPDADRGKVTLYKNPQCDCCEGYAAYLRDNRFAVRVIPTNELTAMGETYGIPDALQPCHI